MKIITTLLIATVLSIGSAYANPIKHFNEGNRDMQQRFIIMNEFLKGNAPSFEEIQILHKQHTKMKNSTDYRAGSCWRLIKFSELLSGSSFSTVATLETNFERGPMVTIMDGAEDLTLDDIRGYYGRCIDTVLQFEITNNITLSN